VRKSRNRYESVRNRSPITDLVGSKGPTVVDYWLQATWGASCGGPRGLVEFC
jgi:hypothetical protein